MALGVLVAITAASAQGEESNRGFFDGSLTGGGRIVFFVQANHSISAYIFDNAKAQASFAGGPITDNHTFSITTSANQTLIGTVSNSQVTTTFLGQNITAARTSIFGPSEEFAGRFTATAEGTNGVSLDVKFVIDAQSNIFMVTKQGTTVLGGVGTISAIQPVASPTPTPSPTPHGIVGNGGEPEPGDDHGGHDGRGRHGAEDNDQAEDHHEDEHAPAFTASFSVTFVTGQVVTGHLVLSHELLLGDFVLNGVTFNFRAPEQSSANHLANISTRGFVNSGQGQLIGGFIITGGPKIVIIRASGPSLANSGVSPALADPVLQLFGGSTLLRQNDNWQAAANANEIIASRLAPTNPNEAAILIRLEPGSYTTVVSGAAGGTGIALVEIYEIARN